MAKLEQGTSLGSYVTAKLRGKDACRQGVLTQIRKNGTKVVIGELGTYICEGDVTVVPDENIIFPEARLHIKRIRESIRVKANR